MDAISRIISKPAGFRPPNQLSVFDDEHRLRKLLEAALVTARKLGKQQVADKIEQIINELKSDQ